MMEELLLQRGLISWLQSWISWWPSSNFGTRPIGFIMIGGECTVTQLPATISWLMMEETMSLLAKQICGRLIGMWEVGMRVNDVKSMWDPTNRKSWSGLCSSSHDQTMTFSEGVKGGSHWWPAEPTVTVGIWDQLEGGWDQLALAVSSCSTRFATGVPTLCGCPCHSTEALTGCLLWPYHDSVGGCRWVNFGWCAPHYIFSQTCWWVQFPLNLHPENLVYSMHTNLAGCYWAYALVGTCWVEGNVGQHWTSHQCALPTAKIFQYHRGSCIQPALSCMPCCTDVLSIYPPCGRDC